MDLFIVIPLMVVVYDCIEAMDEARKSEPALPAGRLASLQSTLVLVAQGLYYQRRNHYLAEALFRVVRGRMSAGEVSMLKSSMNLDDNEATELDRQVMTQAVRSHWPVSVVKKQDMDSLILKTLVDDYAHLEIGKDTAPPPG